MEESKSRGAVIGVTDGGNLVVTEDYFCGHWAPGVRGLAAVRECWYCKYADFRKSTEVHLCSSVCRCADNRVDTQLDFIQNED